MNLLELHIKKMNTYKIIVSKLNAVIFVAQKSKHVGKLFSISKKTLSVRQRQLETKIVNDFIALKYITNMKSNKLYT